MSAVIDRINLELDAIQNALDETHLAVTGELHTQREETGVVDPRAEKPIHELLRRLDRMRDREAREKQRRTNDAEDQPASMIQRNRVFKIQTALGMERLELETICEEVTGADMDHLTIHGGNRLATHLRDMLVARSAP